MNNKNKSNNNDNNNGTVARTLLVITKENQWWNRHGCNNACCSNPEMDEVEIICFIKVSGCFCGGDKPFSICLPRPSGRVDASYNLTLGPT